MATSPVSCALFWEFTRRRASRTSKRGSSIAPTSRTWTCRLSTTPSHGLWAEWKGGISPRAAAISSALGANSGGRAKCANDRILRSPWFVFKETTQYNHTNPTMRSLNLTIELGTNENVVDGDVNQLHEIADQTHSDKTNRGGSSGLSEFYPLLSKSTLHPSYQASCTCSLGTCCL